MHQGISRLLRHYLDSAVEPLVDACWSPSADIYRSQNGWLVKFDLAGVRAEDIQLSTSGNRLIVQGIRRDYAVMENQLAYSMEISYNRFLRSVELPCDIQQADIRSEFRDGMLLVLITNC